jgi:putative SOS response-associated peptidase YedK
VCGRFVQAASPDLLAEQFGVDELVVDDDREPDYNVAPRAEVLAVVQREPARRTLEQMRWGLVPSWAESPAIGDRMINARAESLGEKAAFKQAFRHRRCLVPADGFYEWQARGGRRKQPMFIHARRAGPLALAGLWEVWRGSPDDDWLVTCSIVTTRANTTVAPVHDRMPVVLAPDDWETWLDPHLEDPGRLAPLLEPAPDDALALRPVRTLVNDTRNNGPELVVGAEPDELVPVDEQGSLFP